MDWKSRNQKTSQGSPSEESVKFKWQFSLSIVSAKYAEESGEVQAYGHREEGEENAVIINRLCDINNVMISKLIILRNRSEYF